MNNRKSGGSTLLLSVLMSAPGPLILGLGLLEGHSSTQIADFIRRSAELLAIIMAYATYLVTTRDSMTDPNRRARLERFSNLFVGSMMCLGGSLMLVLALVADGGDKGNVIPAIAIAALGMIANTLFWWKYTRLNREEPNPILAVQARLYRAKSMVDSCVTLALLSVLLLPGSPVSVWLDRIGSAVVAVYLVFCGVQTIRERLKK